MTQREMSLTEWCGKLHATHRVNLELAELRGDLASVQKEAMLIKAKIVADCLDLFVYTPREDVLGKLLSILKEEKRLIKEYEELHSR